MMSMLTTRAGRALLGLATAAALAFGASAIAGDEAEKKEGGGACCEGCAARVGPLSGVWSGEYRYPEGSGQRPVPFTAFVIQEGGRVRAMIREANTFGDASSPWLHADADGRYDEATRTLRFTKSYDGTGGARHDVAYKGTVASDSAQVLEGTWDIDGLVGAFSMKRKASD